MELPHRMGFSSDGWLIVEDDGDSAMLGSIVSAWRDSRANVDDNAVPAVACYPYGDGTGVIGVPRIPIDEAETIIAAQF